MPRTVVNVPRFTHLILTAIIAAFYMKSFVLPLRTLLGHREMG